MRIVGMRRLFAVVALTVGAAASAVAQEPEPATREAAIEQAQAEKAQRPAPLRPGQGRSAGRTGSRASWSAACPLAPVLRQRVLGRRLHARRRLRASRQPVQPDRRARQLHHPWLQARRSGVHRPASVQPARQRCRCSAAGARRRRSASTASASTRRKTTARTTASSSRTRRRSSTLWPTRRLSDAARRRGVVAVEAAARGRGSFPSVETRLHAGDAARPRRHDRLSAHAGHGRASTGARRPATRRRGGFYGVTVHDYTDRDEAFGFRQVDYEVIQHFPILREAWVISLRGLAQTTYRQGRSADPVLHAAVARRRIDAARLFSSWRFRDRNSLLLQAEWRIMVNRFLDTAVFYDAGKVARPHVGPRFQRAEARLRLRRPLPRAVRRRRCASNWPRATKGWRLSSRRPRSSEA